MQTDTLLGDYDRFLTTRLLVFNTCRAFRCQIRVDTLESVFLHSISTYEAAQCTRA